MGGGNVAMDAARSAKRLGAENVYIVYRRSEEEMPARLEEVHHAKEEGIEFKLLNNPVKINGDENGWVDSVTCIKMELGEPDKSGRRRPVPVEGSEFDLDADVVVVAIGQTPESAYKEYYPLTLRLTDMDVLLLRKRPERQVKPEYMPAVMLLQERLL